MHVQSFGVGESKFKTPLSVHTPPTVNTSLLLHLSSASIHVYGRIRLNRMHRRRGTNAVDAVQVWRNGSGGGFSAREQTKLLRPNFERSVRCVLRSSVLPVARFLTYLLCYSSILTTYRAGGMRTRTGESLCSDFGMFSCIFAIFI